MDSRPKQNFSEIISYSSSWFANGVVKFVYDLTGFRLSWGTESEILHRQIHSNADFILVMRYDAKVS